MRTVRTTRTWAAAAVAAASIVAASITVASMAVAIGGLGAAEAPGRGAPIAPDTLPSRIARALSVFAADPDSTEVASLLASWPAAEVTRRSSSAGRIAAAVLWRRAGELDLALAELARADATGRAEARVALERARIGFVAGRGDPAAEFRRACATPDPAVRGELWLDLRGSATPAEQEEWTRLAPGDETCAWIRRFVARRALAVAVDTDAWLALHYERLHAARAAYRLARPRFCRELTDVLGRPDSLELDDRGLVYLRMGPPHDIAGHSAARDEARAPMHSETWAYYRPDGYRLYWFAADSRVGCGRGAGLRLQGAFGPAMRPGEPFFQRYVTRAGIDPYVVHLMKVSGSPTGSVRDPVTRGLDAAEAGMLGRRIYLQAREWAAYAVREIPDGPAIAPRLGLAWEALRFRDPDEGAATVWVVGAVPAGDVVSRAAADDADRDSTGDDPGARGGVRYELGARLARMGPTGELRISDTVVMRRVEVPLASDAGIPVRLRFRVREAGRWHLTLVVRDRNARGVAAPGGPRTGDPVDSLAPGAWGHGSIGVPAGRAGPPAISDIAVAADSGGSWTRDGRVFLTVDPAHIASPDGELHVYFEVYGIPAGRMYDVELRLAAAEAVEDAGTFELEPDDLAFRLRFTAGMPGRAPAVGAHHIRLDLADTEPGAYRLGVRVRERGSGTTSLPVATPVVVPERGERPSPRGAEN